MDLGLEGVVVFVVVCGIEKDFDFVGIVEVFIMLIEIREVVFISKCGLGIIIFLLKCKCFLCKFFEDIVFYYCREFGNIVEVRV